MIERACRERKPVSVGLLGNAAEMMPELVRRGVTPDAVTDQTSAHDPRQRLSAGRLDAGGVGGAAGERPEGGRARRQASRWPCTCARCSSSGGAACRRSTTATTSARWRRRGRGRRLRFSRLRAGLYPPAVLPRRRPVPLGRAVRRSGGHLPHRRQGEGADAGRPAPAPLAGHGAARIRFQGLPARICWVGLGDRHRLGLAFNEMVASGELEAPIVIGRDHLDSGSVASAPTARPRR